MTDRYEPSQHLPVWPAPQFRCPEGHLMRTEWGDYGYGPSYINAFCETCMKMWRLQKMTNGDWDWHEIVLPKPDADKPIDLPPLTSDGE